MGVMIEAWGAPAFWYLAITVLVTIVIALFYLYLRVDEWLIANAYQLTGKRGGGILERHGDRWLREMRERGVLMADQRYSFNDTRDNRDQILSPTLPGRYPDLAYGADPLDFQRRVLAERRRIIDELGAEFVAVMHISPHDDLEQVARKARDYRSWKMHQDKKRAEESKMQGTTLTQLFHTETRYGGIEGGVKVAGTKGLYRVYVVDRVKAATEHENGVTEFALVADSTEGARMAAVIEMGVAVADLKHLHVHAELVCQVPLLPVDGNKAPANG